MPDRVTLALVSLPELIACLLGLLAWLLSLSLEPRREPERQLLSAFRRVTLVVAALAGLSFLAHNRDPSSLTLARLTLAWTTALLPVAVGFARAATGRARAGRELALWALVPLAAIAFAFDPGLIVAGSRTSRFAHEIAVGGPLLLPYLALVLAGVGLGARRLIRTAADETAGLARWLGLSVIALILALAVDGLSAAGLWDLPPAGWLGALAIIIAFSRATDRHYRDTYTWAMQVEAQREDLEQQLIRDDLTGLHTRAYGQGVLERALGGRGACVVFIDLDDFKSWNDRFGHSTGDRVLREVAKVVQASARAEDTVARYAGDEFFVVLPTARLEAGLRVAEKIRIGLGEIRIREGNAVTASLGVARGGLAESAESLLDRADRAAYRAKREGKNRVASTIA